MCMLQFIHLDMLLIPVSLANVMHTILCLCLDKMNAKFQKMHDEELRSSPLFCFLMMGH